MALVIRGGTIEGKALDLAADLLKQGRISRAEAQVIQDLAEVAAKRLSPADRATLESMISNLHDAVDRVTSSIAAFGTHDRLDAG